MWILFLIATLASAAPSVTRCTDPSIDLRVVPVGFRCETSKGAVYLRVSHEGLGEAWKEPDGSIWSDQLAGVYTQPEAVQACKSMGGFLPARTDFIRGERQAFREVLPHMAGERYWTSTLGGPGFPDFAFGYSGDDGQTYLDAQTFPDSARCLAR